MPTPPDRGPKAIGGDLVLPGLALAMVGYFFLTVWDLNWEAKANVLFIGTVLLGLIAIFLARTLVRLASGRARLGVGDLIRPVPILGQRIVLMGLAASLVWALPWLGLTLGLLVFMIAGLAALGTYDPRVSLPVAFCIASGAYLLFIAVLDTRFPRGPVESLLSALF
ncbi:MAG: hypothetical protein ACT4P2_05455 [Pseudomonadota bacterium]